MATLTIVLEQQTYLFYFQIINLGKRIRGNKSGT